MQCHQFRKEVVHLMGCSFLKLCLEEHWFLEILFPTAWENREFKGPEMQGTLGQGYMTFLLAGLLRAFNKLLCITNFQVPAPTLFVFPCSQGLQGPMGLRVGNTALGQRQLSVIFKKCQVSISERKSRRKNASSERWGTSNQAVKIFWTEENKSQN